MKEKNIEELTSWYLNKRPVYRNLAKKVESIIKEVLDSENISYYSISSRAKEVASFIDKAKKEKYRNPVNEIKDMAGIRIITFVKSEVYQCAELIKPLFKIDNEHSVDKGKALGDDKVGYRSVHYIGEITEERLQLPEYKVYKNMSFEIQIRTILEHAWADISHDRNYKFHGVLPPDNDIQRRFSLAAATLELVDREFNNLANEIIQYEKYIDVQTEKGVLDIDINTTSLRNYLFNQFKRFIDSEELRPEFNNKSESIIMELKDYGLGKLSDLDKIINKNDLEKYVFEAGNYIGLLRHIMMMDDIYKYFDKAWNNNWDIIENDSYLHLKSLNINVDEIIDKYGLEVVDV